MYNEVEDLTPDWMKEAHMTGTTIMAIEYNGGVVIAADSRTTTGAYIANRVTDKLTPLHERIFCLRSGSAADTQAIADFVKYNLEFHEMETGQKPLVKTAAHIAKSVIYNNRDRFLASLIVAGWDKKDGGQVFVLPISGMLVRKGCHISGSGSSYAIGYVDAHFKQNMTREEALTLAKAAVSLAIARDGSSGGCIRIAVISEKGVERDVITNDKVTRFYEI